MKFPAHGDVQVRADFPLLINTASGPWNRELVDAWAEIVLPHAELFAARGPWVGVGVIRESMFCTDEAIKRHREIARFMIESLGAVGAVHVAAPEVEGESLMRGVYEEMFKGLCPFAHFQTLEEGRSWALELLRDHSGA